MVSQENSQRPESREPWERAWALEAELNAFEKTYLNVGDTVDSTQQARAREEFARLKNEYMDPVVQPVLSSQDEIKFKDIETRFNQKYGNPEAQIALTTPVTEQQTDNQAAPDSENKPEEETKKSEKEQLLEDLGFTQEQIQYLLRNKKIVEIFLSPKSDPDYLKTVDPRSIQFRGQHRNFYNQATAMFQQIHELYQRLENQQAASLDEEISFQSKINEFREIFVSPLQRVVNAFNERIAEIDGEHQEEATQEQEAERQHEENPELEQEEVAADANVDQNNEPKSTEQELREVNEKIVRGIWVEIRNNYTPANPEFALPEFDKILELPSAEVWDLFSRGIIALIHGKYNYDSTSGDTVFAFNDPGDMWSSDIVKVPIHEAEGKSSIEFLTLNWPWSHWVKNPDGSELSAQDVAKLNKSMWETWRHRIMAIHNSNNSAAKLKDLWQESGEHLDYHKKVLAQFSSRGESGGQQRWDIAAYHDVIIESPLVARFISGDNTATKVEDVVWLMPDIENFFLEEINAKYYGLTLKATQDDPVKGVPSMLKQIQTDVTEFVDHANNPTILKKLKVLLENKYGADSFEKNIEMIRLSQMKAVWNIVNTLLIHEWDSGGVHTKLGRYNVKEYLAKVFETGLSNVSWRLDLALSIERLFLQLEQVYKVAINLEVEDSDGNRVKTFKELKQSNPNGLTVYEQLLRDTNTSTTEDERKSKQKWLDKLVERSLDDYSQVYSVDDVRWLKANKAKFLAEYPQDDLYLSGLIARLDTVIQRYSHLAEADLNKKLKNHALDYAITSRYRIIRIKKEYTGLGSTGLPLAISKVKFDENDTVAKDVPMWAFRESQIATKYVDFTQFGPAPKKTWVDFHEEVFKWFAMLDLDNPSAVFPPIKNSAIQEKIRATAPVLSRLNKVEIDLIKALAIGGSAVGFENRSIQAANLINKLITGQSAWQETLVWIRNITLEETKKSESEGKSGLLDITRIAQYSGKYLFSKCPNPELLLEIYRSRIADVESVIEEVNERSKETGKPRAKLFKQFTRTPVSGRMRRIVDDMLSLQDQNTVDKTKVKARAESEFIIETLFMAVVAYLGQYKVEAEVEQQLKIPSSADKRKNLLSGTKTIGKQEVMNTADMEVFLVILKNWMEGMKENADFYNKNAPPRNFDTFIPDVIEFMKESKIIGSKAQLLADIVWLDNNYPELVKSTAAGKK